MFCILTLNSGENTDLLATTLAACVCIYSSWYQVSRLAYIANCTHRAQASSHLIEYKLIQSNLCPPITILSHILLIWMNRPLLPTFVANKASKPRRLKIRPPCYAQRAHPLAPSLANRKYHRSYWVRLLTLVTDKVRLFFFFSFGRLRGTEQPRFLFQWSSATHQSSTFLLRRLVPSPASLLESKYWWNFQSARHWLIDYPSNDTFAVDCRPRLVITLDIFNSDKHVFVKYSSTPIVVYPVEQNTSCLTRILV